MIENQRVRLSRMMIQSSLTELLAEKSIHKISVREICEHAEINRKTFYKYYANQYDLLKAMENEMLTRIDAFLNVDKKQDGYDIQALVKIITYLQDNIDLCRLLTNNTIDSEFPEKLINLSRIRLLLDEQLTSKYQKDEMDYGYQLVVNGGFSVIKRWINKDERESPEKIAKTLVNLISGVFPRRAI